MRVSSQQEGLKALAEGLLRSASRAGPPGNVLEIRHAAAPMLSQDMRCGVSCDSGTFIRLNQGNEPGIDQAIMCETARLPFANRVFSAVILNHVLSDGMEPELEEAVRVLARDGVLNILGINRLGWHFLIQDRLRRLPGIASLKVKSRLDQLEMSMLGFAGAGLLGLRYPVFMRSGLAGLGSPIADVVLLQARRCDDPGMTPLRRSSVVQST